MKNPEEVEVELRQRKIEITERVDALRRDFRGDLDPDFEEHTEPRENADAVNGLLKQALSELEEIEQKLCSRD